VLALVLGALATLRASLYLEVSIMGIMTAITTTTIVITTKANPTRTNVLGQPCNSSFEPRNLSFGLSEVILHLIYWSAHNFAQTYCCLGTSTMIQGGPSKTSSRSLVDVGIQRDVILYPGNSLQLRHPFCDCSTNIKRAKTPKHSISPLPRVENGVR
jgi:hypothetical protein